MQVPGDYHQERRWNCTKSAMGWISMPEKRCQFSFLFDCRCYSHRSSGHQHCNQSAIHGWTRWTAQCYKRWCWQYKATEIRRQAFPLVLPLFSPVSVYFSFCSVLKHQYLRRVCHQSFVWYMSMSNHAYNSIIASGNKARRSLCCLVKKKKKKYRGQAKNRKSGNKLPYISSQSQMDSHNISPRHTTKFPPTPWTIKSRVQ